MVHWAINRTSDKTQSWQYQSLPAQWLHKICHISTDKPLEEMGRVSAHRKSWF